MRRIYNGISGKNVLFGVTDISAHGHFGGMQVACLLWQRVCSEKFPSRTSLSGGFGKEAFLCVPLLLGSKRAVSPKCGHEPNCGSEIPDIAHFCGKCGHVFSSVSTIDKETSIGVENEQQSEDVATTSTQ